jgi:deoxyadenosine/deoxycytidine kinase
MHIAIAGNIGSGKTTLTTLLAKHYNYESMYENADNNPYLGNFYDDMKRWSFNLQIFFLNCRFRQVVGIKKNTRGVVQDRTIYEDAMIFAPNLYQMGLMEERDFNNYVSLFELMTSFIEMPDLLIYLKADVSALVKNIQKRGREYENSISIDYLSNLNVRYNNWIEGYQGNLLVVDVNNIDFAENPEDLGKIIAGVEANLHGLFR